MFKIVPLALVILYYNLVVILGTLIEGASIEPANATPTVTSLYKYSKR